MRGLPSTFCTQCGTELSPAAEFCTSCGQRVAAPTSAGPQAVAGTNLPWSDVQFQGLPVMLWAVITLFAVPGLYLLWSGVRPMPSLVSGLGDYGYSGTLFAAFFILFLLVASLGAALVGIAWMLYRADRAGRGLAYVAVGMLVTEVIFGDATSTGVVLVMLAGLASAGILAFEPSVRATFTGPQARQRDQPTGVVVARVVVAVWAFLLALFGVLYLLLEQEDHAWVALGILFLVLAAGAATVSRRLLSADPNARLVATVAAIIAIVLMLIGEHDGGFVLGIGLTIAVPICLWLPADTREFFGDAPRRSFAGK